MPLHGLSQTNDGCLVISRQKINFVHIATNQELGNSSRIIDYESNKIIYSYLSFSKYGGEHHFPGAAERGQDSSD